MLRQFGRVRHPERPGALRGALGVIRKIRDGPATGLLLLLGSAAQ